MRVVCQKLDGTVAIITFVDGMSDAIIARDVASFEAQNPGSTFEHFADEAEFRASVPSNRRFRNCWTKATKGVQVDMVKARSQRLSEIRIERDAALAASDVELLRAQEAGADTKDLVKKRQDLRDLPVKAAADLDQLSTPAELDAYKAL